MRKRLLNWSAYFVLTNALVFYLVGAVNLVNLDLLKFIDLPLANDGLIAIFVVCALLGHMTLLAGVPLLLCLPFILCFPRKHYILMLASLSMSVALVLLFIDQFAFLQYRYHLNGLVWQLLLSPDRQQILGLSLREYSIFAACVALIITLETGLAYFVWYKVSNRRAFPRLTILLLSACLCLGYLMFLLANSVVVADKRTMLTYHLLSLHGRALPLFVNTMVFITPDQYQLHEFALRGAGFTKQASQSKASLHYPLQALQLHPAKQPLNVLLIVIDAWRFDMVDPKVTPNIYAYAQHTWQFTQHMSGGNSTRPGIFSLFYGLPSTYWASMLQAKQAPVLMQAFQQQGYEFGIFASAPLTMPEFDKTVFADLTQIATHTHGRYPYQRDAAITDKTQTFLRKQHRQPFFAFVFYDTAHSDCEPFAFATPFTPYVKVCNRFELNKNSDPTPYFNRYKNALHYVDGQIAKILATLAKQGLDKNTLVILTGDHGQEFNDNHLNYWGHTSNFTRYQVQTPLLMHWPTQQAKRFTQRTSHYDMAPSLLHWLFGDTTPPSAYSIGQLLTTSESPAHLLIGSYVGYGILSNNTIINIYPTGGYQITDQHAQELPHAKLDMQALEYAFKQTRLFYNNG